MTAQAGGGIRGEESVRARGWSDGQVHLLKREAYKENDPIFDIRKMREAAKLDRGEQEC
jgi:hypothetical protein